MNEQGFLNLISGRTGGVAATLGRAGLRCLVPMYSGAIRLRNSAFDTGLRKARQGGMPVISVGNLTTGGTGKTPLVAWITNKLTESGYRPALVSRGYRSGSSGVNDEKLLLDRLCPGVPHFQNPDRLTAVDAALHTGASVAVLDDAFQHRRIQRDLDIVLIDATCPFGYGYVLPRGLLREPESGLGRADVVVMTRTDQVAGEALTRITERVRRSFQGPIFEAVFSPQHLVDQSGAAMNFDALPEEPVGACCGIGNPAAFRRTLDTLGIRPVFFEEFPDHHRYAAEDIGRLSDLCRRSGCRMLVCTEKDIVKFPGATPFQCLAVRIGVNLQTAVAGALAELILGAVRGDRRGSADPS